MNFKEWYNFNELRKVDTKVSNNDVKWKTSVRALVFGADYENNSSSSLRTGNYLPIFPSFLSKLSQPIKCFHITSPNNFPKLIMLQHSKRSISCSTVLDRNTIKRGIHGNGVIVHLSGNLLIGGMNDLMSIPDANGHRWINARRLDFIPTDGHQKLGELVTTRIFNLKMNLFKKYNLKATYGIHDFAEIQLVANNDIINKIIKEYIDESKKIWEEIIKIIDVASLKKSRISEPDYERSTLSVGTDYNEILVNNITILYVIIANDPDNIVEDICNKNRIRHIRVNKDETEKAVASLM